LRWRDGGRGICLCGLDSSGGDGGSGGMGHLLDGEGGGRSILLVWGMPRRGGNHGKSM
jgi:hypothetical protein